MYRHLLFVTLLLAPFFSMADTAISPALTPYKAVYQLIRKGDVLGRGQRQLTKLGNNRYELRYQSDLKWFIFSDKRLERSLFIVEKGRVQPLEYEFSRSGTGRDKHFLLHFDPSSHRLLDALNQRHIQPANWQQQLLDPLSYQIQIRLDLDPAQRRYLYQAVNEKGREKQYLYEIVGEEQLKLPIGEVNTIKLRRQSGKRLTYAWLAPGYHNLLVRLWQSKKGVEQYDIQLESVTFTSSEQPLSKPE